MPSLRQWQRQYQRWLLICSFVVKEIRRGILIGKQIREIYKRFDPVWFCRDRTSFDIWENIHNIQDASASCIEKSFSYGSMCFSIGIRGAAISLQKHF